MGRAAVAYSQQWYWQAIGRILAFGFADKHPQRQHNIRRRFRGRLPRLPASCRAALAVYRCAGTCASLRRSRSCAGRLAPPHTKARLIWRGVTVNRPLPVNMGSQRLRRRFVPFPAYLCLGFGPSAISALGGQVGAPALSWCPVSCSGVSRSVMRCRRNDTASGRRCSTSLETAQQRHAVDVNLYAEASSRRRLARNKVPQCTGATPNLHQQQQHIPSTSSQ